MRWWIWPFVALGLVVAWLAVVTVPSAVRYWRISRM